MKIPAGHVCSKKKRSLIDKKWFSTKVITDLCPNKKGSYFVLLAVMQFLSSLLEIAISVIVWMLMGLEDIEIHFK